MNLFEIVLKHGETEIIDELIKPWEINEII